MVLVGAPTGDERATVVGLVSDTHGWLDPTLLEHFRGAALIVHAGDVGDPEILERLERTASVLAVRGNIDGGVLMDLPLTAVAEVAGRRIAALHIAGSPVRPNVDARTLLATERPDVLVVGHSHIAASGRVGEALWINPGAAGHQGLHERRTAGLLRLWPDGRLECYRIHLGARGSAAARR